MSGHSLLTYPGEGHSDNVIVHYLWPVSRGMIGFSLYPLAILELRLICHAHVFYWGVTVAR